jgi:hypothetical protein
MTRILGFGWVDATACGSHDVHLELPGGVRSPKASGLFVRTPAKWGRFDEATRATCLACELALRDAGLGDRAAAGTGILTASQAAAIPASFAYFQDYAACGRTLGRSNLFMYTLPTSPAAEAAIHFGVSGPLLFAGFETAPLPALSALATGLCQAGEAPAVLAVLEENGRALAWLVTADAGAKEFNVQGQGTLTEALANLNRDLGD